MNRAKIKKSHFAFYTLYFSGEPEQTESNEGSRRKRSIKEIEPRPLGAELERGRRRRSIEEIEADDKKRFEHIRSKRGIKYKCDISVVLGVMFYDLYNKKGILAKKCCCDQYKGELFEFYVTIDEPWTNILMDQRSNIFRYALESVSYTHLTLPTTPYV